MPICYHNHENSYRLRHKLKINEWIKHIATLNKKKVKQISFVFCSEQYILEVNRQYLAHDYYTDVITFDYSVDDFLEAEVYISPETVRSNAKQFGVSFNEEIHRVIIHSILHLLGYDDTTDTQRKIMTYQENIALAILEEKFITK